MPRPKKIKSPEDFGKEFEKLKKPRKPKEPAKDELQKEPSPLEELQELEKKLRACTTETPRDIKYEFSWETCLHIEYNNINVSASIAEKGRMVIGDKKGFRITAKKPYLATAHKMLEVLKEWREE